MLERTFVHLPGIGGKAEQSLWKQGCLDWNTYAQEPNRYRIGSSIRELVTKGVNSSINALEKGHHQYFARRLRQRYAWRAFEAFRDRTVFLDIETDGANHPDCVTTIGMWDGHEFRCLIQGNDLENFRDLITHYSTIVTFFGTGFDLPVLQRRFPDVQFDQIHIDLCPLLKHMGYRGGLKKIEQTLGIERSPETVGLTGYDAVHLWRKHLRGSDEALERLIAYNREDCVNLETLAVLAVEKLTLKPSLQSTLELV
ncbi:MAG TPA: ribonuclease H-like domain-containing protein [Fimbriimonadaceae bacterium]|nr:ribonuclease H-like domain-containing protein [Fimbriimonadaceae bacterium]